MRWFKTVLAGILIGSAIVFVISLQADSHKGKIAEGPSKINPLIPGESIPDVEFRDSQGNKVSLSTFVNKQPVILIFYRGGWCPYCSTQLGKLQTIEAKLVKMGYKLLAVSPDNPERIEKDIKENGYDYTLLSDSSMEGAKKFGVAYRTEKKTPKKDKRSGSDTNATSGKSRRLLPVPSVYIINKEGKIIFNYTNIDYKIRLNPEILLTAAKELRSE